MELSTIAKPYAQAIFEIAEKNDSLSVWSELLSTASAIMVDNTTQAFISSPSASKSQKIELICTLLEKATLRELSKQESAFVNLILNNGSIDDKGKVLKKTKQLKTSEEKEAYTVLTKFIFNLKRLLNQVPGGKSKFASYAAAAVLFLKEEEENEQKVL